MNEKYIKIFMSNLLELIEYINKRKRKPLIKEKYICNGIYVQTTYSKITKKEYRIIQRNIFKWQSKKYTEIDECLTFDFDINNLYLDTIIDIYNIFKIDNNTFYNYFLCKNNSNSNKDSIYKYFKINLKKENIK